MSRTILKRKEYKGQGIQIISEDSPKSVKFGYMLFLFKKGRKGIFKARSRIIFATQDEAIKKAKKVIDLGFKNEELQEPYIESLNRILKEHYEHEE